MYQVRVASAWVAAVLVLASGLFGQPAGAPVNLGFEEGEAGQTPAGWFVPPTGFSATLSPEGAHEGALCVRLAPGGAAAQGQRRAFGNVMQVFDAAPFRGKRVVFEGWVRCEAGGQDSAQLWLRVDRAGGTMGFFDNMGDRPIRDAEWKKYRIAGDIEPDAGVINIGLLVVGNATAWGDGFSVRASGEAGEGNDKPRRISDRGLVNLVALTRLSGDVRFFHPSSESQGADWDSLMIAAVGAVEPAADAEELAAALRGVFGPIAPTVRVWAGGADQEPAADATPEGATGAVAFKHTGVNISRDQSAGEGRSIYSSRRVAGVLGAEADLGISAAGTSVVRELGGGVWCRVPVTLYTDGAGTLPHADGAVPKLAKPDGWFPSGNDRSTRLIAVMLAWNVIQNFYPYFEETGLDWPAVLPGALQEAAMDADAGAFHRTLRVLNAMTRDGHGNISGPGDDRGAPLDLDWAWVGDALVVTRAPLGDAATGLAPGDVVRSIDGVPIAECARQVSETISAATEQWRRYRVLGELKCWAKGQGTTVIAERGTGDNARPVVATVVRAGGRRQDHADGISRPMSGAEVSPGIVYFDLCGTEEADLDLAMPRLGAAKGIIFDLRGYPGGAGPAALRHLSDQNIASARWMLPVAVRPDREGLVFERAPSWDLPPMPPRLTANVAFLTDGEAISFAESCMGIVENYKLGEIIGGATAGTNGNINPVPLPGGYTMVYTGMRVLKHDGSAHHGVGIRPTIPCERTIEGITAGRDELMEKALEVLKQKMAGPG